MGKIGPRQGDLTDTHSARRMVGLLRPHVARLVVATIAALASTAGFLAVPVTVRNLLDSVFLHRDQHELNVLTLALLALVIVTAICSYIRGVLLAYVGGKLVADLRLRLYDHLNGLDIAFYDRSRTGDLMSRLSADTILMQTLLSEGLLNGLQFAVRLVAVVIILVVLDWRLALVSVALAPVIAVGGLIVGRRTRRLSERAQAQLGDSSVVLEETLAGVRTVRAFGRETYEMDRYGRAVDNSFAAGYEAGKLGALFESSMLTMAFVSIAAVLWVGGHEVLAGHLTPGGLVAVMFYLTMLTGPLQGLAQLYGQFQQAAGGGARVFAVLDTLPEVTDPPGARALPTVHGDVAIRDVWFSYGQDGPDALRGVSLSARQGEVVALVGPSGAGKTTLTSLLLGFYRPRRGTLSLDEHDSGSTILESWRRAVAVVPQDPVLFGGTVSENIAYGKEGATREEIERAAGAANAHDFIVGLAAGYDTVVGDRGVRLSGGQKQRVAIARALLKDAPLLILDEATSSLDNTSEALVQEALSRLMRGRTTLVIAHRLTTVERADRIVVLDSGQVVAEGTHTELLAQRGLYHRLYTRAESTEGSDTPAMMV